MSHTPPSTVATIADRYDVDPSYFAEKYSMPVGERRNAQPMLPTRGENDDKDREENNNEPQDDDNKDKKK